MSIEVYQYPACGTCKKAIKWLKAQGIEHTTRHIVDDPPSRARLAELVARSGVPVRKWLNTSGQSYRQGGFKEKLATMSDAQILDALAADGRMIKRPIVIAKEAVLVGFSEADYQARLG